MGAEHAASRRAGVVAAFAVVAIVTALFLPLLMR